jgi:hypothetical protein
MPDFYTGAYGNKIPIIDDDPTARDLQFPGGVGYGCVPRDYAVQPPEMFDPPTAMALIPESEWDARFDEQEENKSSLEHLYLSGPGGTPAFEHLDQGTDGHCWAYSTGHAMTFDRLKQNLPPVRFNPHGVATMLKRFNGGWSGLSAEFAREHGYPVEGTGKGQWPFQSNNSKYDTTELRAEMAKYRVAEEWVDLARPVYSRNITEQQSATCSFNNIPGPEDFNHWSHAICRIRHVRIEKGSWGKLFLNSWKGWGRYGLGVLRGSKMRCDGAMAIRRTTA